jgi:hypothetical protein
VNQDVAINIAMDAVMISLKVALPLLVVGLARGLVISIFQAITQIQEMTLSYIRRSGHRRRAGRGRAVDAGTVAPPTPPSCTPASQGWSAVNALLRQVGRAAAVASLVLGRVGPLFLLAPLFSRR